MSNIDPTSSVTNVAASSPKEAVPHAKSQSSTAPSSSSISFLQEVKGQLNETAIILCRALLVIGRITLIFLIALLMDNLILAVISWSFGGIIKQYHFAALILEGIQLLSALGTAAAYILYLIPSLIKDAKKAVKDIERES